MLFELGVVVQIGAEKVLFPTGHDTAAEHVGAIATYRGLGAQMKSLWLNAPWAMWVVTKIFRYDIRRASAAPLGLSNRFHRYGSERAHFQNELEQALRFRSTG